MALSSSATKNKLTGNSQYYAKTVKNLDAYMKKKLIYCSADLAPLFATTMQTPTKLDLPGGLAPGAGTTMKMIFAEEVMDKYAKCTRVLTSNMLVATIFVVIWGLLGSDNMHEGLSQDE